MKFKLDENLTARLVPLLEARDFEVQTVRSQSLSGTTDENLFNVCRNEHRTLVTLDLDFANPFRFPPAMTSGTIVLRPPVPSMQLIHELLLVALDRIAFESPERAIWIVEPGRIRVWRSWDED
jgi:predicted nuclease of predicted toxin-antitoxin system